MIGHSLLIDLNLFLSCKDFRTSFSSLSLPNSSDYPQENYSNCIALFASFAYGTILSPNIICRLRRSAISVFFSGFHEQFHTQIYRNKCVHNVRVREKKKTHSLNAYIQAVALIHSLDKQKLFSLFPSYFWRAHVRFDCSLCAQMKCCSVSIRLFDHRQH